MKVNYFDVINDTVHLDENCPDYERATEIDRRPYNFKNCPRCNPPKPPPVASNISGNPMIVETGWA